MPKSKFGSSIKDFPKSKKLSNHILCEIYGEYTCTIASIQNSAIYRKYVVANTGNNEPKTSTIR